jgi:formylglycine-generating enzyme required for sulfatase activity
MKLLPSVLPTQKATELPSPTPKTIDSDGDGVPDIQDAFPNQGDRGQGVDAAGCSTIPAGTLSQNPVDEAEMVFVPAGEFQMGLTPELNKKLLLLCEKCTEKNFADAMPLHKVDLDAY